MDALSIHPYPDNSSQPPTTAHPNTTSIGIADYGKLVALLAQAFDGTAQPGSALPILYAEFGVESQIPAAKSALYTGEEPAVTRPSTSRPRPRTTSRRSRSRSASRRSRGCCIFLSRDERARAGWQSGVHYVDGTAKSQPVRA